MSVSIGRIVHYTLTDKDAEGINARRKLATEAEGINKQYSRGCQIHAGTEHSGGQKVPMIVTRLYTGRKEKTPAFAGDKDNPPRPPTYEDAPFFSGQAFLDGTDTLFVKDLEIGEGKGKASWPVVPGK